MADTVTGFTASRMQEIEDSAVVGAEVVGDDLIMTRHDTSTFNAGNVRGAVGPQNPDGNPAGAIIMGGWATAPVGYLFLDGTLIAGGVATYPDLASIYPGWVVGADLQMPNAADAVPMQGSPVGLVSGSMTHTLTTPQLPSHTHPGPNHRHTIAHGHSDNFSATTNVYPQWNLGVNQGPHDHDPHGFTGANGFVVHKNSFAGSSGFMPVTFIEGTTPPPGYTQGAFGWGSISDTSQSGAAISLTGGITAVATTVVNGNVTAAPASTYSGYEGTGNTGPTGTGSPINHTPKNLKVKYAVKT